MTDTQPGQAPELAIDVLARAARLAQDDDKPAAKALLRSLLPPARIAELAAEPTTRTDGYIVVCLGCPGLGSTADLLGKTISAARRPTPATEPDPDVGAPYIPLHEATTAGREALRAMMTDRVRAEPLTALYAHRGRPVRLRSAPDAGVTWTRAGVPTVAVALSEARSWVDRYGRPCDPPEGVVRAITEAPEGALPVLDRVAPGPCFDAGGRLVQGRGYHGSIRAYLDVPDDLHVADAPNPSLELVTWARDLLRWWLQDFPFASDYDRCNAYALAITPLVRPMYDGPTPLYMVTSPARGSGKTLLVMLAQIVAMGATEVRTWPRPEEVDRAIFAAIRVQPPILLWDNVDDALHSGAFASLLTSRVYHGRILGVTEEEGIVIKSALTMTGRSPPLSDELSRRTRVIHLVPASSRPWERSGWACADIERWTTEHRAEVLHALVVLVRAWEAAGRPPAPTLLGSYDDWSRVVGGIISHHFEGWCSEPTERAQLRINDAIGDVLTWWCLRTGSTAFDEVQTAASLAKALRESGDAAGEGMKVVTLGRLLAQRNGSRLDIDGVTWELQHAGTRRGTAHYRVVKLGQEF